MLTTDVFVELHVPDFEKGKEFYGKLGFGVVWEREKVENKGYLVMRRGASVLNFFCGWAHSTAQRRTPPRNVSSVFGPGSLLGILAVLLVLKSFSWKLVALPAAVVFDFGSWNAGRRIRDFLYRLS